MRSPAYYKEKLKLLWFRIWWIICGCAVVVGIVDFLYDLNQTGELQFLLLAGLVGGLCAAVKVNVTK